MPKITFIDPDGARHELNVETGLSLMKVAVLNNIAGIEADCGGACACATCHVYVDPAWIGATGTPANGEAEMLDYAVEREATSRLSCQIEVTEALDGLVVRLPVSQH